MMLRPLPAARDAEPTHRWIDPEGPPPAPAFPIERVLIELELQLRTELGSRAEILLPFLRQIEALLRDADQAGIPPSAQPGLREAMDQLEDLLIAMSLSAP